MRVVLCGILLFIFSLAYAQTPLFYASMDTKKIVEGSYVTVTFTLENADGNNFRNPSFDGFQVLSGPSKSSSMQIINNQVSKKISFSYNLSPKYIGKIKIGQATIETVNGTLRTEPLVVEVIKGSNKPSAEGDEVFVVAEISDSTAYVGQQVSLNYKLYTTLDVRQINFLVEPEYEGFFVEEMRSERRNFNREIINGTEYFTKSVKKISLFPQQTGTYEIEAIPINLGIATENSRRGFFFSSQLVNKRVLANGITILVDNTPNTNKNFSGAIGNYQMNATTPKRSITTDDAIIVSMQISGNGDNKAVMAPAWPKSDSLEVYDPNIITDQVIRNRGEITHRKTFEYLLVPKIPGQYKLKPRFTFFDPDSNNYVTLTKVLPTINVIKGKNNAPLIKQDENLKLSPIYSSTKLKSRKDKSYSLIPQYALLGSMLLACLGIFLYGNKLEKSGQRDPEVIRRNKAYEVALGRLKKAEQLKDNSDSAGFHEEIVVALKKFFTDKYKIQALHIKKHELMSALHASHISEASLDEIKELIDKSELALYSPGASSQMEETYLRAVKVISDLEGSRAIRH